MGQLVCSSEIGVISATAVIVWHSGRDVCSLPGLLPTVGCEWPSYTGCGGCCCGECGLKSLLISRVMCKSVLISIVTCQWTLASGHRSVLSDNGSVSQWPTVF